MEPDTDMDILRQECPGWRFWRDGDEVAGVRIGAVMSPLTAPNPWAMPGRVWGYVCDEAAEAVSQGRHVAG